MLRVILLCQGSLRNNSRDSTDLREENLLAVISEDIAITSGSSVEKTGDRYQYNILEFSGTKIDFARSKGCHQGFLKAETAKKLLHNHAEEIRKWSAKYKLLHEDTKHDVRFVTLKPSVFDQIVSEEKTSWFSDKAIGIGLVGPDSPKVVMECEECRYKIEVARWWKHLEDCESGALKCKFCDKRYNRVKLVIEHEKICEFLSDKNRNRNNRGLTTTDTPKLGVHKKRKVTNLEIAPKPKKQKKQKKHKKQKKQMAGAKKKKLVKPKRKIAQVVSSSDDTSEDEASSSSSSISSKSSSSTFSVASKSSSFTFKTSNEKKQKRKKIKMAPQKPLTKPQKPPEKTNVDIGLADNFVADGKSYC